MRILLLVVKVFDGQCNSIRYILSLAVVFVVVSERCMTQDWRFLTIRPDSTLVEFLDEGLLDGSVRTVDGIHLILDSGQVGYEATICEGTINGIVRNYNGEGIIIELAHYRNDRLHGRRFQWDDEGYLVRVEVYHLGTLLETVRY